MHEDLKILHDGDTLSITLPLNETTIERANVIIKERRLAKYVFLVDSRNRLFVR